MSLASAPAASAYEAVIGIEIHVQLRTLSKMFCGCTADVATAPPNSVTCPVCLGLPGALPAINREAVRHVLATGLAVGARLLDATRWDRKNYFYPDLPKGYQISQYDLPLAAEGSLTVETASGPVRVGIRRAHLEEDTARLQHQVDATGRRVSLVDFNRSGLPLMEIVTEPDIRSAEAARRYAEELRLLLVTIGASDAAMENGQMRVEANVSLRRPGSETLGTRVEVKNMNSFRAVERAIDHEIERQAQELEEGGRIIQETRGWDDSRGETYPMRLKEDSDDYRYFPEPDLPPLRLDTAWLEEIRAQLPELPAARRARYRDVLGLSPYDAAVLVGDGRAAALFEATLRADSGLPPKRVANWATGEYLRLGSTIDPQELAHLVRAVEAGEVSGTNAKEVFRRHAETGEGVDSIIAASEMRQISDEGALRQAVDRALAAHPEAVADVRAGKGQAIGFLTGQVMKETRGQANAGLVRSLISAALTGNADKQERGG